MLLFIVRVATRLECFYSAFAPPSDKMSQCLTQIRAVLAKDVTFILQCWAKQSFEAHDISTGTAVHAHLVCVAALPSSLPTTHPKMYVCMCLRR